MTEPLVQGNGDRQLNMESRAFSLRASNGHLAIMILYNLEADYEAQSGAFFLCHLLCLLLLCNLVEPPCAIQTYCSRLDAQQYIRDLVFPLLLIVLQAK